MRLVLLIALKLASNIVIRVYNLVINLFVLY